MNELIWTGVRLGVVIVVAICVSFVAVHAIWVVKAVIGKAVGAAAELMEKWLEEHE